MAPILGVGSLYAAVKTVGNRLVGSTLQNEYGRNDSAEADWESEATKQHRHDESDTKSIQHDHPRLEDKHNSAFQHAHNRDREEALTAIRNWEDATTSRIQREKARRLERLPSPEQRDPNSKQSREAVLAWERATVGRFQQERARRLQSLSLLD